MALDITGASIGYDSEGINKVIEAIQVNCIDEAITKAKDGVDKAKQDMDAFWIGASADAFKDKMDNDTAKLIEEFGAIRDAIENEIKQMAANVNNSDSTIAEDIKAQIQ